jgi:hypothetical protein
LSKLSENNRDILEKQKNINNRALLICILEWNFHYRQHNITSQPQAISMASMGKLLSVHPEFELSNGKERL